ncbi:MAG: glycosyltransferase family 2 protein [bacterium]|nr:glycosyltransferase family 2 protein [bacterium]
MALNARNVIVIIPALNEVESVGLVVDAMPAFIDHIIVVDNGSTDATADVARSRGAHVCVEPRRGYGQACLSGIAYAEHLLPDIIVFADADFSDNPLDIIRIVTPVSIDEADMVIGSRVRGSRERGSLTPQQVFGNWLATRLIRLFWRERFTDLGPLRAIRWTVLRQLNMQDTTYGWTVEMQIKAARMRVRCLEVPVDYRRRIGTSKISGTFKGTVLAGTKILSTIARNVFR